MTDKVIKAARQARLEMWSAFKSGISLPGYHYYQPPPEIMYRYPAPGSVPRSDKDHWHLYKDDWKTPFRVSKYNIQPIEVTYEDDDPRENESYTPWNNKFDTTGKRGHYD